MVLIVAVMITLVLIAPGLGKLLGGMFSDTASTINDMLSGKPLVPG